MTREKLFEMIEYTDDRFLSRSEKNTVAIPVKGQKKVFPFKTWKIQYVAAAIAIILLTSVTAVAAVAMIRRQAELKEQLGISGKEIPDYVEFDVGDTEVPVLTEGNEGNIDVTVLSGVRDEEFQTWYFTIGPISKEDAQKYQWIVTSDTFEYHVPASPAYDWELLKEEIGFTVDEYGNELIDPVGPDAPKPNAGSYDEETQTLMLRADVYLADHQLPRDRTEPVVCTVFSMVDPDELESYEYWVENYATWEADPDVEEGGVYVLDVDKAMNMATYKTTAVFTPTAGPDSKVVSFGNGVPFTNPDSGAQGTITDVVIYASGSVHMHYTIPEDADTMNRFFNQSASMPNAEYLDLQDNVFLPWSNAADEVMSGMTINLKDGSNTSGSASVRLTYKDGVLEAEGSAGRMIALDEIESVTIAGQTFEVE